MLSDVFLSPPNEIPLQNLQLSCWWHYYLDYREKSSVITSIKVKEYMFNTKEIITIFHQHVQAGIFSLSTGTFTRDHLWQVEQILYEDNEKSHLLFLSEKI
jgi:hypothetical protein